MVGVTILMKDTNSQRWKGLLVVLQVLLLIHLQIEPTLARFPTTTVGQSSFPVCGAAGLGGFGSRRAIMGTFSNSLYSTWQARRHTAKMRLLPSVARGRPGARLMIRNFFPIMDIVELAENAWEFYVERDDILTELLEKGANFIASNKVKAVGTAVALFIGLDLIARTGIIGDRGEGLIQGFKESEYADLTFQEKVYRKVTRDVGNAAVFTSGKFRSLSAAPKFAVALLFGALLSKTTIHATSFAVKYAVISFFALETLAFTGFIGEPGEGVLEWIDDHRDDSKEWTKDAKRFRQFVRRRLNVETIENMFEVAFDKERLAVLGFASGSLVSAVAS